MRLQFGTNGTEATGITPAALDSTASTGRKPAAGANTGASDRISLSFTSSIINRDSVNRSVRIQQLSQAVQAGTYQISSQSLSTHIVSAALGR